MNTQQKKVIENIYLDDLRQEREQFDRQRREGLDSLKLQILKKEALKGGAVSKATSVYLKAVEGLKKALPVGISLNIVPPNDLRLVFNYTNDHPEIKKYISHTLDMVRKFALARRDIMIAVYNVDTDMKELDKIISNIIAGLRG